MPRASRPAPAATAESPAPSWQPGTHHRRRLREIWRSAGWPCQDIVEAELLAAGLLQRCENPDGRVRLRLSDAGVQALVETAQGHRRQRDAHERLVAAVATQLARNGRLVWRGVSLRAQVHDGERLRWQLAMPDVYSLRHTSVAAYLQPVVHEIKVRRADLLADLRRPAKRAAYLQMAGAVYYVLAEGIARTDEIPAECGVVVAHGGQADGADAVAGAADGDGGSDGDDDAPPVRLELLRPAPTRAMPHDSGLPFGVWMALARAHSLPAPPDGQLWLGAGAGAGAGTGSDGPSPPP